MKQSFDAIVDTFADIGLLLPEFQQVRNLFDKNDLIKDVLVLFFRDILDFYLIVLKFFRKTCESIHVLNALLPSAATAERANGFLRLGIDIRVDVDETKRKDQCHQVSDATAYTAAEA